MNNRRDSLLYNADGYYDPTAGQALQNVTKEKSEYIKWKGQPIYVCASELPMTEAQYRRLECCCRFVARQGGHPISPFLFYAEILDLTDRSCIGMILRWTRSWLRSASEIWIFGDHIPGNIRSEVNRAMAKGKVVRFFKYNGFKFVQTQVLNAS